MNKEYFLIMSFPCFEYIVKYKCNKSFISRDDIENSIMNYYHSDNFDDNKSYQDRIHDIMSSLDGIEYEIIDSSYIDVDFLVNEYEK